MANEVAVSGSGRIGRHAGSQPDVVAKAAERPSARARNSALYGIPVDPFDPAISMDVPTGPASERDYTHVSRFRAHNECVPLTVDRQVDPGLCFVIIPFVKPFDGVLSEIKRTVEPRGMKCLRADETPGQGVLVNTIMNSIRRAILVIADISLHNPNVFYEVGVAHAWKKKVIVLWAAGGDKIPSDLCHWQYILYENTLGGGPHLRQKLGTAIDDIMKSTTS